MWYCGGEKALNDLIWIYQIGRNDLECENRIGYTKAKEKHIFIVHKHTLTHTMLIQLKYNKFNQVCLDYKLNC